MGLLSLLARLIIKSGGQAAASVVPLPGISAVADLLCIIIGLCESVEQNRNTARQLAKRCTLMYHVLEQYEATEIPDRANKYRISVFQCLAEIKSKMTIWAEKSWLYSLLHQGEFEAVINGCHGRISDCLTIFATAADLESLAWQREDTKWKQELQKSLDSDHGVLMKVLSSVGLAQQDIVRKLTENQAEMRTLLGVIQKGLAKDPGSKEHDRMASNLYDLLQLSNQLPPEQQLDSGEVEWTSKAPVGGSRNVDIYRGRYLKREDVTIKVIRSVKKDEESTNRIRREIELWAKMYEADKGRHILPFYGFCTTDGGRLPWIENGDALAYVKKNDRLVGYRKLVRGIAEGIGILHGMNPPIIHGELKATKVLIGGEGQPLLTDFGLAKLEGNLITQSAGISDAYRWYAPEMSSEASTASTKSDVYSFGMTILELFTHQKPYAETARGIHVILKVDKGILPERPTDSRILERGLDDGMWEVLTSCWLFAPERRPSIKELLRML